MRSEPRLTLSLLLDNAEPLLTEAKQPELVFFL